MLDWRGLFGTSLIHGAVLVGWPALDLTTTICLCSIPSSDMPVAVEVPGVRRISTFPVATLPPPDPQSRVLLDQACGGPAASAPILLDAPDVPRHLSARGSIAFCASVDAHGRVTALRLLRSGDHSRRSIAAIRRLLRQARFKPPLRDGDGRVVASRIEIALTS